MLLPLAWAFAKVGLLGFGGGYTMLALIQKEVRMFGIGGREFVDIVALSQMTPGPIGINAATYTGYQVAGLAGAAVATFSNILPTCALMLAASVLFVRWKDCPRVQRFLQLLRPLFIGLIASSLLLMARDVRLWADLKGCAIFLGCFVLSYVFDVSPLLLLALAGLSGIILY